MKKIKLILIGISLCLSQHALAVYNANIQGVVAEVITYTDRDDILFKLQNQPASHPECEANYFAIDINAQADRRHQVLARLLTALTSGNSLTIGYDGEGDCAQGRIRVHRVG
ncbi:MAG: hypothetical protein GXP21_02295 [Gammaproteobacteria bacterium]|nr:hypothetical protein [Gammaproteobacteria bacterium]